MEHRREYYLTIRARDTTNQSSNVISMVFYGSSVTVSPIVLDLDNDGVELVSLRQSTISYSMSDAVDTIRTGWVGADDALLVLDRNRDGTISGRSEISFMEDVPGAVSDIEGLAAFDTNHDGYFNTGDARFAEFQVWQDRNQDGVSQSEELRSLADTGVRAVGLTRTLTGESAEGAADNVITATAEMVRTDGSIGVAGDVTFAYLEKRVEELSAEEFARRTGLPPTEDVDRGAQRAASFDVPAGAADFANGDSNGAPSQPAAAPSTVRERGIETPAAQDAPPAATDAGNKLDSQHVARSETWEYQGDPRQSALNASLDSVARRRLQMIDAMASFSNEGSATLELRPQRHVDSRTLELLTAVSGLRTAA